MTYLTGMVVYDKQGNRQCEYCQEFKTKESFSKNKASEDSYRTQCKECDKEAKRLQYYGIIASAYKELWDSQNGCCAICEIPENESGKALAIDHDHECCSGRKSCGKCVRGLLCTKCNVLLGMSSDSPEILQRATAYLLVHA
jgi:hypothetical protein